MGKTLTHWVTLKDVQIMSELISEAGVTNENKTIDIKHTILGDGRVMKHITLKHNGVSHSRSYVFTMEEIAITENISVENDRLGINI